MQSWPYTYILNDTRQRSAAIQRPNYAKALEGANIQWWPGPLQTYSQTKCVGMGNYLVYLSRRIWFTDLSILCFWAKLTIPTTQRLGLRGLHGTATVGPTQVSSTILNIQIHNCTVRTVLIMLTVNNVTAGSCRMVHADQASGLWPDGCHGPEPHISCIEYLSSSSPTTARNLVSSSSKGSGSGSRSELDSLPLLQNSLFQTAKNFLSLDGLRGNSAAKHTRRFSLTTE